MARPKREPVPVFVDEDAKARDDIAEFHRMRELMGGKFTDVEIRQKIEAMPPETRQKVAQMVATLTKRFGVAKARLDFAEFAKRIDPDRLPGRHFDILTKAFHRIADGEMVRLIINIAPRRGKSEYSSYLFPGWFIGRFPKRKILQVTNIKSLASDFGSKIRNLLDTPEFQEVFPSVKLSKDASAKDKWRTNYKGEYFAAGVGSTIYGRGGDLCVHPDSKVVSERGEIKASEVVIGDRLLGKGVDGWAYGDVTHRIETKSDSEVVINGKLRCTPTHPIWIRGKGWTPAGEVKAGDQVYFGGFSLLLWKTLFTIKTWKKKQK